MGTAQTPDPALVICSPRARLRLGQGSMETNVLKGCSKPKWILSKDSGDQSPLQSNSGGQAPPPNLPQGFMGYTTTQPPATPICCLGVEAIQILATGGDSQMTPTIRYGKEGFTASMCLNGTSIPPTPLSRGFILAEGVQFPLGYVTCKLYMMVSSVYFSAVGRLGAGLGGSSYGGSALRLTRTGQIDPNRGQDQALGDVHGGAHAPKLLLVYLPHLPGARGIAGLGGGGATTCAEWENGRVSKYWTRTADRPPKNEKCGFSPWFPLMEVHRRVLQDYTFATRQKHLRFRLETSSSSPADHCCPK